MKYITKPFERLPVKKRACLILSIAGMTVREIALKHRILPEDELNRLLDSIIRGNGQSTVAD